jgi:hypothetical protein
MKPHETMCKKRFESNMKNVCVTRSTVHATSCRTVLLLVCKVEKTDVILMEEQNLKVFENKTLNPGKLHNGGFHFICVRTIHLKLIS